MRITVDIDEHDLQRIQAVTGIKKRSPAVRRVVADYVKEMEKKQFLRKVMEKRTDYPLTNDQLEKLGSYDAD